MAEAVASQADLHAHFGGVVPEVAARIHIQACLPLIEQTLTEAGTNIRSVEAIAVTYGPGLIGCLLVGIETAKSLAWLHGRPLIAVNHLAGHVHAIHVAPRRGAHLLMENGEEKAVLPVAMNEDSPPVARPPWPHLSLVVSGGHTSLVWVESPDRLATLAQTRDDAVGEAFDKVARVAGLGYPGGPVIDRLAAEGNPTAIGMPTPMKRRDQPDFSFSGLKTAAGREAERLLADNDGTIPDGVLRDFCASFQSAAVEAMLSKALAMARRRNANDLVVTGGVACNRGLRRRARELTARKRGLRVWFPHPSLCTDNAAMIAGLAWHLKPLEQAAALRLNATPGLGVGRRLD